MIGHVHGPGSPEWLHSLRKWTLIADLATDSDQLSTGVTADHGMVTAQTQTTSTRRPACG